MRTDARQLPESDCLDMGISLAAMHTRRRPVPSYRVLFRLRMHNAGSGSVRLIGRKWTMRDAAGDTRIIEAAGIFNQQPVLKPGEVFSYSGCQDFSPAPPVAMELRLFGTDQGNRPFITPPLTFPKQCFTRGR